MVLFWQDKISETVFEFTTDQLLALVDFIVLEAAQSCDNSSTNGSASSGSSTSAAAASTNQNTVKSMDDERGGVRGRLDLLLSCILDDDDRIRAIVAHIQSRAPLVSR